MQNGSVPGVAKSHAVVIAGGGPTGLMLAAELALARVDVAIVERRENSDVEGLRAGGLHMRTIELFDQRGIAERFVSQGPHHQRLPFARTTLDVSDMPTRHNYSVALWQYRTEHILTGWVGELGVPIYRKREVADFEQDGAGVDIALSDGASIRAQYLAGCDGARSSIRKKAGIEFPGWDASTSYLIAEIDTAEEPEWGFKRTEHGNNAIGKLDDGKRARAVLVEPQLGRTSPPTLEDVREALVAVYGTDFGLQNASYVSRFSDTARQAAAYRKGRVLLAGDAAHMHSPVGGQGLNIGIQDAVNLGWKLAQVVHGTSPESLLDSYHAERHPVGARLLRNTMAITAIERRDDRVEALRELMIELMQADVTRKQYVAMMSGLDVHYDLGPGHPLLGRRMPDLDILTADGSERVFASLHAARPVLLNLGEPGTLDIRGGSDRVRAIDARYTGPWELPGLGPVSAPTAVLIRPDGYVAWVGERDARDGLDAALTKWFGPSSAAAHV